MNEMKLVEDFCAAEPPPHPQRLARARSELIDKIGQAGPSGSGRTRPRTRAPGWPHLGMAPRLRGWVIPLAAAAAVVAITVPLAIFHGHAPATATPGGAESGPGGAPPFYLAVPPGGLHAVIAATATGKTLATIKAPPGVRSLIPVGAAASDRTFILGAAKTKNSPATEFLLVRFHPGTKTASLTPLPIHLNFGGKPAPEDSVIFSVSSPGATRLAVIKFALSHGVLSITTYALSTGSSRTWTVKIPGLSVYGPSAAWSANGRDVQVVWQDGISLHAFADRLDTAKPGTRLPRPAELPLPPKLTRSLETTYVSPGGDVFLTSGVYQATWNLAEFSPRTGQLTQLLGPVRRTKITPSVQWASNTGHVLIITGKADGLGVLRNGRYLPLPLGILHNSLASAVW